VVTVGGVEYKTQFFVMHYPLAYSHSAIGILSNAVCATHEYQGHAGNIWNGTNLIPKQGESSLSSFELTITVPSNYEQSAVNWIGIGY